MSAREAVSFRPKVFHLLAAVVAVTGVTVFAVYLVPLIHRRRPSVLAGVAFLAMWDFYFVVLLVFRPAILRLDEHGVTHGLLWKRRTMPWSSIGKVHVTGWGDSTSIHLSTWSALRHAADATASDPSLTMTISNRVVRIEIDEAAREICSRVLPATEIVVDDEDDANR